MPLFEFLCEDCGQVSEILVFRSDEELECSACHGKNLKKLVSATSTASGINQGRMPGAGDTSCCGSSPSQAAGCAGPGSCCGKLH